MSSVALQITLFIVGSLLTILIGVLAWIGKDIVVQLKNIARSVSKIEKDMAVLSNDHVNLKEEVYEMKNRIAKLERA